MTTRWSLDKFPTFPLIQTGRHKTNAVIANGSSAPVVDDTSSALQATTTTTTTTTPEPLSPLRCFREDCGSYFTDDGLYREHTKICRIPTRRYHCAFTKCAENFTASSIDAFIRHQATHRIWYCEVEVCAFRKREKALKHVTKHHKSEESLKVTWLPVPPRNLKKDVRTCLNMGVNLDLGDFLTQFTGGGALGRQASALLSPRDNGGVDINGVAESLQTAVLAHVLGQLNMLGDLLEHQSLSPSAAEHAQIVQSLDRIRDRLGAREQRNGFQLGWNAGFGFQAGPESTSSRGINSPGIRYEIGTISVDRSVPAAPQMSPTSEMVIGREFLPNIESESEDDSDGDIEAESSAAPTMEPQQEAHLEKDQQIKYFEHLQKCCIEAAFTFYKQHKSHLDTINDRSSKPLCITAKREEITSPTDLSLPHWTHLLRRISDARGLQRDMVSRIESFNGDISPVDEIQHAFKKEKVKSDRDLLALIQLTRNFCWQLKDWERCKLLDDLYGIVEKDIKDLKSIKRKSSQREGRPQRPGLYNPMRSSQNNDGIRNGHRPSATWPRLPPGEEVEA
ncbi:uncharacterized protein H6S33_002003 [Morchella sextelata]|uniref:uncharacterized protein n=1 Tax=Morchella sextelata TaxID=1174677 RepID=UPI001D03CAE0|nr:uncharacterized protein H6S33_002003 [Morchella sextelata]KAH0607951.1 hypothetical protein H6S33_002003 [Morchella sextelata]